MLVHLKGLCHELRAVGLNALGMLLLPQLRLAMSTSL